MKNAFRKTLLVSIAVCCIVTSYAQDSLRNKPILSPTIEITGGPNFPLYKKSARQDLNINRKLQYAVGLQLGMDIAYKRNIFSIQMGAIVNSNDFSTTNSYHLYEPSNDFYIIIPNNCEYHFVFVNIPFTFGYHYRVNNKFMISVSTGYIIKQLAHYKMSYTIPGFDIRNKTMHGISAAVGFSYVASPHFSLRIEPVFEYFWWKYPVNLSGEYRDKIFDCFSSSMIGLRFTLKCNILKEYN